MTRTRMSALALAVALTAAAVSPAVAAPIWGDDEKVVAKVAYKDAELRTTAGAARIASRIRTAARQVCGGDNPVIASGTRFQHCQHKAIDQAIATLDAPLVANALGRSPATTLAGP
jgi:UrcA family protein